MEKMVVLAPMASASESVAIVALNLRREFIAGLHPSQALLIGVTDG